MWLQSIAYVVDVFLVFKLAGAVVDKVKYSALYLVFYSILATAIIIDNFYINGFILGNLTHLMPVACVCFIGFMVCLYLASMVDAYKMAQKTAELERELSELNTTLMISQIQPHFLYNALNTIKYTIKKDPKVAESAIIKFSNYLRANMDSITQKEPIPIAKELDHVKNYIDIEQLRFGERLHIEYDIGELADYCEELDEDLGDVEEILLEEEDDDEYEDEDEWNDECDGECDDCELCGDCEFCDDEDYFEIVCPSCGETVCFDESVNSDELLCPACQSPLGCIVEDDDKQ
jgi:hypothetical protein